jgi:hypothetical protein
MAVCVSLLLAACGDDDVVTPPPLEGACAGDGGLLSAGTVCRPAAGGCDVAETCTGDSVDCPADVLAAAASVCRPAAGDCDIPEQCTGSSSACPIDALAVNGTECRAAAGLCDVTEACTGSSADCPADLFEATDTVCRPAAGDCDVAESCTGSSAECPSNLFAGTDTVCRAAATACDAPETCPGDSIACPADAFVAAGTSCGSSATTSACDVPDTCAGTSSACVMYAAAGTVCRAAVDACDVAELCSGDSGACPPDTLALDGVACCSSTTILPAGFPAGGGALCACNGTDPWCPILDGSTTLVVNGDAEAPGQTTGSSVASIIGWTRVGSMTVGTYGSWDWPLATNSSPTAASNLFGGANGTSDSNIWQDADVSYVGDLIDAGWVGFELSAWLGGWLWQNDSAKVDLTFLDAAGNPVLDSGGVALPPVTIGPVTNVDRGTTSACNDGLNGLLQRSTTGTLPPGTRTVRVRLTATFFPGTGGVLPGCTNGGYNDGYADDIVLLLTHL